jgi:hypothetical protein
VNGCVKRVLQELTTMRHILLASLLVLMPVAAVAGPDRAPVRDTPFPDVPRDHWAYDAVEQLRKVGILRGYPPAQTFSPKPAEKPKPASAPRRA